MQITVDLPDDIAGHSNPGRAALDEEDLVVNGNQMSGTYATVNCTVSITGSFTLTKE